MGSKARHAKELLPIILKDHKPEMWYVEPFVGGANMIDKVSADIAPKRLGCDFNEYLIEMWKSAIKGTLSFSYVDKEAYASVRDNKECYDKGFVGWVAHGCSYNGKWFGGFAGELVTKEGNTRNYQNEAANAVKKQAAVMQDVIFKHKSVFDLTFPKPCTIYCDPPYAGTTKYKDEFDHAKFYDWCRERKKEGHTVFVSEYWMPDDFICVWEKQVNSGLNKDVGSKKATERLYTL